MSWLFLLLLQSILEFLPVSSSVHLELFASIFSMEPPGQLTKVALHLATLVSLVVYFRATIFAMVQDGWQWISATFFKKSLLQPPQRRVLSTQSIAPSPQVTNNLRLLINLVVATIPAVIVGFCVEQYVGTIGLSIGGLLIMGGIAMALVDRRKTSTQSLENLTINKALLIGSFQVLALVPGVSRLGSCLVATRMIGLNRRESLFFSFLLSIPTITAAVTLVGFKHATVLADLPDTIFGFPLLFSIIFSLILCSIMGYYALHYLSRVMERVGLWPFALYRIIIGILLIAWR